MISVTFSPGHAVSIFAFMLAILLLLMFLSTFVPASRGRASLLLLVALLCLVSTIFAQIGVAVFDWELPWNNEGEVARHSGTFDIVSLPLLIGAGLIVWFLASRIFQIPPNRRFVWSRAMLLAGSAVLYEIGMLIWGWPAPWHLRIPSQ